MTVEKSDCVKLYRAKLLIGEGFAARSRRRWQALWDLASLIRNQQSVTSHNRNQNLIFRFVLGAQLVFFFFLLQSNSGGLSNKQRAGAEEKGGGAEREVEEQRVRWRRGREVVEVEERRGERGRGADREVEEQGMSRQKGLAMSRLRRAND